jgi:hypothetical protein
MDCPKCGFTSGAACAECLRCGVVFAKIPRLQEAALHAVADATAIEAVAQSARAENEREARRRELTTRAIALPGALPVAWLAVKTAPSAVRLLTMWVHESGHAVSAWLCGYAAWPGPWFTPIGAERSLSLSMLLVGLLAAGAYRAWLAERRVWTVASVAALAIVGSCTLLIDAGRARQLIVFSGDGGCLVLGTALMLAVFAPEDSALRRDHLRWALLAIGALAFMDAYVMWTGSIEQLPFGENDNGLSDPSVLAEEFGWSVLQLTNRYRQLAHVCLAVLGVSYLIGVVLPAIGLLRERESR